MYHLQFLTTSGSDQSECMLFWS